MKEKLKRKNEKKGISLIVLVITIIVIVILAVAVILSIANNNPIENANKAKFQSDVKTMQEELELIKAKNYAESNGATYNYKDGSAIKISDLSTCTDEMKEKFDVVNGELVYNNENYNDDSEEINWIKESSISDKYYELQADDMVIENGVLKKVKLGSVKKHVKIPSEITSIDIGDGFDYIDRVESIIMSDDVEIIEANAFEHCWHLRDIKLSNNLKEIREEAFYQGFELENITIPDSVISIEDFAFYECNDLIITISSNTFKTCFEGKDPENAEDINYVLDNIGGKEIVIK